jgi:hypothetical protein
MSTLSQFLNGGATTQIVNSYSSGGINSGGSVAPSAQNGAREVISGALTADTLATLLTVDGPGRIPMLTIYTKDATSRTLRLVVEVDGVTVFDATSSAISTTNVGMVATGSRVETIYFIAGEPIVFSSSLVVRVASSLTETDKLAIAYILHRN